MEAVYYRSFGRSVKYARHADKDAGADAAIVVAGGHDYDIRDR
jgi:hypothetical protein